MGARPFTSSAASTPSAVLVSGVGVGSPPSEAAELVAVAGRLNNAFRRLGSGWAIFVEAQRSEAATYPASRFPDPASALVDAERKALLLEQIAQREGIDLAQTVAVGDGANDLKMLAKAGVGVAFRAKPLVRAEARQALGVAGLDGVLYLLGYSQAELIDPV